MTTLGICIPTYKRPEFLRRCVLSAIASAEGRPLHVFIADDSVADTNFNVLSELTAAYPFVSVHRNPKNLGIDANIQQVVDLCVCDYAWLIGEDDEYLPGAVAAMYDFLQDRDDPFVFSAYQYVSEDHSRILGTVQSASGEVSLIPIDSFIERQLWSIGFIGAVVIHRGAWGCTQAKPYLGTYFTHVGRILDMIAMCATVPTRNRCAVANRAQGDDTFTWKKDSFGVFLGFERMCEAAAIRNSVIARSVHCAAVNYRNKFAYFSIKTTFRLRSEGALDLRQFRVHIAMLSSVETWRKLWILFLVLTPTAVLKPFARAYVGWAKHRYCLLSRGNQE